MSLAVISTARAGRAASMTCRCQESSDRPGFNSLRHSSTTAELGAWSVQFAPTMSMSPSRSISPSRMLWDPLVASTSCRHASAPPSL
jgi:hypothetical protein